MKTLWALGIVGGLWVASCDGGALTIAGNATLDNLTASVLSMYTPVVAAFSVDRDSGVAPATIQFTDQSTGDYDSVTWDFGDGTAPIQMNPGTIVSHTYPLRRQYSVTLTASGTGGTNIALKEITVYTAAIPAFTADATAGVAPFYVQFTDTSTGDYDVATWDFGDGSDPVVRSPSERSVAHIFTVNGLYTVRLTVSGNGGTAFTTRTITVYAAARAAFSASPTDGTAPLTVQFTNMLPQDCSP